jgi:hypothetical protein
MVCILFSYLLLSNQFSQAQCIASGPRNPGSSVSVPYAGSNFDFDDPGYAIASDNNRANASALVSVLTGQTENLQVTNFGFSIPPTAIICGIQVDVQKMADNIGIIPLVGVSYVRDLSVKIIKNGIVIDSNAAKAANWSQTEGYSTYGGSTSLWGTTWMASDINASNFGLTFSADIHGLAGLIPQVLINHIRIRVYYYEPGVLSVVLPSFEVTKGNDHSVLLEWTTGELNQFTIQRSIDNKHWESLAGLPQTRAGSGRYSFIDATPMPRRSYYRLVMTWPSGETTYSVSRSLLMPDDLQVHCYPNPFTDFIQLTGVPTGQQVMLTDVFGQQINLPKADVNGVVTKLRVSHLKPGLYFVWVGNSRKKIIKL